MTDSINRKINSADPSVQEILFYLQNGIKDILDRNLIGLYLLGSLTYGGFNPDSSDIDLVAIINKPLDQNEREQIKQLHQQAEKLYPKWAHRLECSYLPVNRLKSILPPQEARPYYGDGIFYDEAPYGNEWIINNYLLYEHGVALIGPLFNTLTRPIEIIEVQKACIRDLFQEWEPKITDEAWLENSHYQSYLVMNLCRILYTVLRGMHGTKKISAEWAKHEYALPWIIHLIEAAESWTYGKEMSMKAETIDFIKFTSAKIRQTKLYHEMFFER